MLDKQISRDEHNYWMDKALALAEQAARLGEVPVGAVVCRGDQLVSVGFNRRELRKDGTAHAEFIALREACKALDGWRLHQCRLYVTLEPCVMCAGAIINTRIPTVIYGASDPKAGCFGSLMDVRDYGFNHHPQIISGVRKEEASHLLTSFFKDLRKGSL